MVLSVSSSSSSGVGFISFDSNGSSGSSTELPSSTTSGKQESTVMEKPKEEIGLMFMMTSSFPEYKSQSFS